MLDVRAAGLSLKCPTILRVGQALPLNKARSLALEYIRLSDHRFWRLVLVGERWRPSLVEPVVVYLAENLALLSFIDGVSGLPNCEVCVTLDAFVFFVI